MSEEILTPGELRERGFHALVAALGWANAVRFIQQFDRSKYDYTAERENMLPNWDARELVARAKQRKQ